jgi:hypothetical protein
MNQPADPLRYGYWPARQLNGEIPPAIKDPEAYEGFDVLNITHTQTGLSRSQQRQHTQAWIEFLPTVPATTIVLSSKVSDDLFAAACAAPQLEALSVKWSSITTLEPLRQAASLKALFFGSSPTVEDLAPLGELTQLRWLFIENVKAPVDLSFVAGLKELREFGLSASRGKKLAVKSLAPLAGLSDLEMLWLVSLQVEEGGLAPLHSLQRLVSLRSTIKKNSPEFQALCQAVPSLKYFQPVG